MATPADTGDAAARGHVGGIIGVLLSAGSSARFGSNKCLARLDNGTAMGLQSALNLADAVASIVCVVGPEDAALQQVYESVGLNTLVCTDARSGMSASLKAGIEFTRQADGWVIALADMPWIKPATCRRVADALRASGGIVAPTHHGKRGHPVGFSRDYTSALCALQGDTGAKPILDEDAASVRLVSVDDPGIHLDIDEPGDMTCAPSHAYC